MRKDFDKNYYNSLLGSLVEEIIAKSEVLFRHPAFDQANKAYLNCFYDFVGRCFVTKQVLKSIPEILTYSALHSLIFSDYMRPFYRYFEKFPSLREELKERLRK